MRVNVSIDGVLRNTIQKIEYHYFDYYMDSEIEDSDENDFEYKVEDEIKNDNLLNYFKFQSGEELDNFLFTEFPIEIFGHAGLSYPNVFTELNKLIFDNKKHRFRVVGVDNFAKSKPATLFFLSKNGFLGNSIEFINSKTLEQEWKKCNIWITDDEKIIKSCPEKKFAIKLNTKYNDHFSHNLEINKLSEINDLWKTLKKKSITLTSTK